MLARDGDGVDRGEPRCFAARRNVEFYSHPADKLGRTPFGRQPYRSEIEGSRPAPLPYTFGTAQAEAEGEWLPAISVQRRSAVERTRLSLA